MKELLEYVRPVPAVVVAALITCPPNTPSPPLDRDGSLRSPEIVDDAVEINPFKNARVVDVACSLVESLVNGKAKVEAGVALRVPLVRVRLEPIVSEPILPSAPAYGIFEDRDVIARFVVVPLTPVKFCRVVEPRAR